MREIKTILYYRLEKKIRADHTSKALKISKGTVINMLNRFEKSGLSWPLPQYMSDSTLENLQYPPKEQQQAVGVTALPTIDYLEEELTKPKVTLQ